MNNLLQTFRDYPAVAGISVFLAVSAGLAVFLGILMQRAGMSLRPLVFFFGFLAIVGVPQAVVHLLDAWSHARGRPVASPASSGADETRPTSVAALRPVSWEAIFGADADPSLITDAKRGLGAIVNDAEDARLSFRPDGASALAARFATAEAAADALNRYGTFFQFAQVSGSDARGWTARRFNGQGEWNHVVTAGPELYAWSGPTREGVEARRIQALGPLASGLPADVPTARDAGAAATSQVSRRLSKNVPVMSTFLVINLALAVGWFFKASAWSTRTDAAAGVAPLDSDSLRNRLLALNHADVPVSVTVSSEGEAVEITWRYADARWFDLMRVHRMRRTHKLVLNLDPASRMVRVREFISAFDASAGADGLRLEWHAATGMQFFQVEHRRVFGAQLGADGQPTGDLSAAYTFDLQSLKAPIIEAVTTAGWTWQPVMWRAPAALRWLTE